MSQPPQSRRPQFVTAGALLAALGAIAAIPLACGGSGGGSGTTVSPPPPVVSRSSSPLAMTDDDHLLVAASPDTDTAVIFDVTGSAPRQLAAVPVGSEPRSAAWLGTKKAYVANAVAGPVSVLSLTTPISLTATIPVGTEPQALVLNFAGTRLFVGNAGSDSISVIDTTSDAVTST